MKMEQNARRLRETILRTLPETKRTKGTMMEQNARIPRTKKTWRNKTVSWKSLEPHSAPELYGQQAPEPWPEPGPDDGTVPEE